MTTRAAAVDGIAADGADDQEVFAVKLHQGPFQPDHELEVLEALQSGACPGIPAVHGRLDLPSQGFLLRPLGFTLAAADSHLLRYRRLYKAVPPLVEVGQPCSTSC